MKEANFDRVVFYDRNDLSAGFFRERVRGFLRTFENVAIVSINDAIEAHQCKLFVDSLPELFAESDISFLQKAASSSFSSACRFVHSTLSDKKLSELFEETEMQYMEQFWQLLDRCGATKRIEGSDLETLVDTHPECISAILEKRGFVENFSDEMRGALLRHQDFAAELIIGRFASDSDHGQPITLPKSLSNDDIDTIMLSYLNKENPNPNYIGVLVNWPSGTVSVYNPSVEVRVLAKRRHDKDLGMMFKDGDGVRFGSEVCIDMTQKACKGITCDGLMLKYTFSGQWLEAFMDPATIMNNCIYLFDYVDFKGIMQMPARKHEESALMASLGLRARNEYRATHGFWMRNGLAVLETIAYSDFLERHDTSLESALEWVYSEYFESEYGIKGFSLALPSAKASWLDKCKAIGPEIERALKAYVVYSKYGEIDDEYFPYESIKSFANIPSLKGTKYAVAGESFESWSYHLFSDQSMLAHPKDRPGRASCLFNWMRKCELKRGEYAERYQRCIDWLIENSLVQEDGKTGRLLPTRFSLFLKLIWDDGAIVLNKYGDYDRKVIDELVDRNVLSYSGSLFSPNEAAYLNYVFNDALFPNSLGLRNRYDHAHTAIKDANSDEVRSDYFQLLTLLIAITIKINEELMNNSDSRGLEDFIDWPYYDESVFETTRNLLRENS